MHDDLARNRSDSRAGERSRRGEVWHSRDQGPAPDLARYLEVCREAEAARLLVTELGRRHGPMA